ncbi:transcriptional repressor TCF25-domain-containing protein [Dipodascopsis uninucleata]
MSSRAVRRALRNQEVLQSPVRREVSESPTNQATIETKNEVCEDEENDEYESQFTGGRFAIAAKSSMFALLDEGSEEDHEGDDEESEIAAETNMQAAEKDRSIETTEHSPVQAKQTVLGMSKSKSKKSKKKNRSKNRSKKQNADVIQQNADNKEMDEIDAALEALRLKDQASKAIITNSPNARRDVTQQQVQEDAVQTARLLSINTKNLDPEREMRKFFGRRVFQEGAREVRRANNGLARPIASKRYVLVQPADDWPPLIGASGMNMEIVGTEGDVTMFKFSHTRAYMDVQRQFYMCIQFGDAELLIDLLQRNFYHVSTLLQVSEILTHHGEHNKAAKTVERALFTYNKSFHSMFNIASGRVRLPFKYYENRGFYLSIYRHVKNLERRGTWLTAFEFLKLLLSVSAEEDPYCILLIIDFFALQSRNEDFLFGILERSIFKQRLESLPNIAFSVALGHSLAGNKELAEQSLTEAAQKFPWTYTALCEAVGLNIITGHHRTSPSARQKILTELYLARSQTLWSAPSARDLLTSVEQKLKSTEIRSPFKGGDEISRDLVRHILLTDIKSVLALLPREYVDGEEIWTDDMLPPLDSISPYPVNPLNSNSLPGGFPSLASVDSDNVDTDIPEEASRGVLDGLWSALRAMRGSADPNQIAMTDEINLESDTEARINDDADVDNNIDVEDQNEMATERQQRQSYLGSFLRRLTGTFGRGGYLEEANENDNNEADNAIFREADSDDEILEE